MKHRQFSNTDTLQSLINSPPSGSSLVQLKRTPSVCLQAHQAVIFLSVFFLNAKRLFFSFCFYFFKLLFVCVHLLMSKSLVHSRASCLNSSKHYNVICADLLLCLGSWRRDGLQPSYSLANVFFLSFMMRIYWMINSHSAAPWQACGFGSAGELLGENICIHIVSHLQIDFPFLSPILALQLTFRSTSKGTFNE